MVLYRVSVLCLLTVVLALAAGQTNNICDICTCTRDQGQVKSVLCDCQSGSKDLVIVREKMVNVDHIKSFSVSNCSSLTLQHNSFAAAHDLLNVTLSHVHRVKFNIGVFSSLSSLLVENVGDLQLARGWLMAGEIEDITITHSNISDLPAHAIFNAKGLKKIELRSVSIGRIMKQAIKLVMAEDSTFIIAHCHVDIIERGAIELQTTKLLLTDSHFQEIGNQAVNVTASQGVEIMNNVFGAGSSNKGILVKSNRIEINGNLFNILPIGLLTKLQPISQITFTNNIVSNFTLNLDGGVDLKTMLDLENFRDNKVLCDCNVAKSVIVYMSFQLSSSTRDTVKENYCFSEYDTCKLSLESLANEKERVCGELEVTATTVVPDIDTVVDAICKSLAEHNPTATSKPETDPREGRAEGFPDKPSTAPTTTTHMHDTHEAAQHTTAGNGDCTVNRLLITLIMLTASAKPFLI